MDIARNAPCPCGSGRKHKKCCLLPESASGALPDVDGSLRRKIMNFVHALDHNHKYIAQAQERWGTKIAGAPEEKDGRFLDFMDYFVHDFPFPPSGRFLLDLFLDARGRSLPAEELALLTGWLKNWKSFFEVSAVDPGAALRLKDLVTGEEYAVNSKNASRQLHTWDMIYTRLIRVGEAWETTGMVRGISRSAKDEILAYVRDGLEEMRDSQPAAAAPDYLKAAGADLNCFIEEMVARQPGPIVVTSTRELVTHTDAVFDVTDGAEVRRRLEDMADFSKAGESNDKPGGLVFNWLHDGPAPRDAGAGVSIRGTLTLTATELFSFCLSQERMDALTALLEERLGSLVRFKISRRTPLKAPVAKTEGPGKDVLPKELEAQIIGKHLDEHYRRWPDLPVPALRGLTPRQAVSDPATRPLLDELLKDFENSEERQSRDGRPVYGIARLRAELFRGEPAGPAAEKIMEIALTPKQYKALVNLVYMGDWLANSLRDPADIVKEYRDVSELVYSRAKDAGLEAYVEKDMEPVLEPHIEEYDEENFWEKLESRLSARDLERQFGREAVSKMSLEEYFKNLRTHEERYAEAFEKNGLSDLVLK